MLDAVVSYYRLEDDCPLIGEWSMREPRVRDMMRPILRLASRMISQACLLPFVCFPISVLITFLTLS